MNDSIGSSNTSSSLLLRIRDPNDKESWRTFERIYSSVIRNYCRCWKLQDSDAEDISQEVMSAVAKQIRDFDYNPANGRFRGWLGTITSNKIKTFLTRKNRRQEIQLLADSETPLASDSWADPDSNWVTSFSEEVFREACQNVRPDVEETTWRSFQETWIKERPAADVAAELGIPVHSVYVNKSRVIKRLEQEVQILADDVAFDFG